jgi:putative ABC transport system permease protein
VVNETLGRTLWPGQDAIGQRITQSGGTRVIGVVADVRHPALEETGGAELYLPMRQTSDYSNMQLVMRSTLSERSLASAIRAALRPVDPNLPVRAFQPLQDRHAAHQRALICLCD